MGVEYWDGLMATSLKHLMKYNQTGILMQCLPAKPKVLEHICHTSLFILAFI